MPPVVQFLNGRIVVHILGNEGESFGEELEHLIGISTDLEHVHALGVEVFDTVLEMFDARFAQWVGTEHCHLSDSFLIKQKGCWTNNQTKGGWSEIEVII